MKRIPLSRGLFALVDDEDFLRVSKRKWCVSVRSSGHVYALSSSGGEGNRSYVYLHRFVMRAKRGQYVDHVSGDGLDNRKKNLRLATNSQNSFNSRKHVDNLSGFKGVSWHKASGKWNARIMTRGRCSSLGLFTSPRDAAKAYDIAARAAHGPFAKVNFNRKQYARQ